MNNEWITDRKPTRDDGLTVYDRNGSVCQFFCIAMGDPWKHIPQIEPYVKPKRWFVVWSDFRQCWAVRDHKTKVTICLRDDSIKFGLINGYDKEHREAAERVAAIFEEVMP